MQKSDDEILKGWLRTNKPVTVPALDFGELIRRAAEREAARTENFRGEPEQKRNNGKAKSGDWRRVGSRTITVYGDASLDDVCEVVRSAVAGMPSDDSGDSKFYLQVNQLIKRETRRREKGKRNVTNGNN